MNARPSLRLSALVVGAVLAAGPGAVLACVGTPELHAQLEGGDIRLSWSGGLEAGDQWVLYNPSLSELEASLEGAVLHSGPETEFLHAVVGEPYYRLRCEGAGGNSPWSNAAFRVDRTLRHSGVATPSPHLLSLPLRPGLPDVGPAVDGWGCDQAGDGSADFDDALCALWTDRDSVADGRFSLETYLPSERAWLARHGDRRAAEPAVAFGTPTSLAATAGAGLGFFVRVEGEPADNPVVLVGSHDPDFPGVVISAEDGILTHVIAVPYHSMYRSADELLCGLEDVDWFDADGSGTPDTCPNGLFDPVSGGSVTVQRVVDDPFGGLIFESRTVFMVGGNPIFIGVDFELVPGEAYLVNVSADYQDRVFLPPTW